MDEAKSRCAWMPTSHNLAGFTGGIKGRDLLARMRLQAETYGVRMTVGSVRSVERLPSGIGFRAALGDGQHIETDTVVLATGVIDAQPAMPGLWDAMQRGLIRVCPICDGYEVIDHRIAVLGHGAQAVEEALFIRTHSPHVTLLTLDQPMRPTQEDRSRLDTVGIRMEEEPVTEVVAADAPVIKLVMQSGRVLAFDTLYSALGTLARSALAEGLKAKLDAEGRLIVDRHQRTSIPGFYAAGDVVSPLNQIAVAMGEGAVAATAIHNDRRRHAWTTPPGVDAIAGCSVQKADGNSA